MCVIAKLKSRLIDGTADPALGESRNERWPHELATTLIESGADGGSVRIGTEFRIGRESDSFANGVDYFVLRNLHLQVVHSEWGQN